MGKPRPRKAPKKFDATLKHLIELYPLDWLRLLHVEPAGDVTIIDSDLSTLTAAADKVIRVAEAEPWLLHFEVQSSYDATLPGRMQEYSTFLWRRHRLHVWTVAVLLCPDADGPAMTGTCTRIHPRRGRYLEFWYDVMRVWELPAEAFLQGGLGVIPLSVVAVGAEAEKLPIILQESKQAASSIAGSVSAREVLAAEYILLGLKYAEEFVRSLFTEVREMRESTTFQGILEEGRKEGRKEGREEGREAGLREAILSVGELYYGPADESVRRALEAVHDIDQLKSLLRRARAGGDWSDLLNGAAHA